MAAPLYPQTSLSTDVTISTANTNLDGVTGAGYGSVATGSAGMDEIDVVYIQAGGATTAGMIRLWVYDGTTAIMVAEIPVPPNTPINTFPQVPVWRTVVQFNPPLRLPSTSHVLRASTHIGETFYVLAQGRKYT